MPTREGILRDQTFKDDGLDTGRRVFYTLDQDNERLAVARTRKLLALLIQHLEEKKLLTSNEVDELLFECVM